MTIIGGMDTGGGVGFGIGADYSGGQIAKPDKIIEEHNARAKFDFARFNDSLNQIEKDSSVYQRTLRYLDALNNAAKMFIKRKSEENELNENVIRLAKSLKNKWRLLQRAPLITASLSQTDANVYYRGIIKDIFGIENENFKSLKDLSINMGEDIDALYPEVKVFISGLLSVDDASALDENEYFQNSLAIIDDIIDIESNVRTGLAKNEESAYLESLNNIVLAQKDIDNVTEKGSSMKTEPNVFRLYETTDEDDEVLPKSDGNLLEDVSAPNYRLAIDASPRVCGNCRFFKGEVGLHGKCEAFDFRAKANFVCDAWQAQQLSATHTIVRDDERYPGNKASMEHVVYYEETPGKVPGLYHQDIKDKIHTYTVGVDYSGEFENDKTIREIKRAFLPGDVVYSKSLRTFGIVQGDSNYNGVKLYSLKLIDKNGVGWGSGFSYAKDLQPRSQRAAKKSIEPDTDIQDIVDVTRDVYRALKTVVDRHVSIENNANGGGKIIPLDNDRVLSPLRESLIKTLQQPLFVNVRTGPKRKYYRAIQTALSSIGAARQILFESYKAVAMVKQFDGENKARIRNIVFKAQQDAYERVKHAFKQVEDSLMLPSATHNQDAPGFE